MNGRGSLGSSNVQKKGFEFRVPSSRLRAQEFEFAVHAFHIGVLGPEATVGPCLLKSCCETEAAPAEGQSSKIRARDLAL